MSCCTCNTTPCCCGSSTAPQVCCTPTTESVEYTFENQGLIGVGVYDNTTDYLVGFRSIASDTLALTVTYDSDNHAVIISFNDELLIDDIPTMTETVRGIAEVATQAETNAGIVDNVVVTPLKLNDRTATETRTGIAEIATQAEVTTGTDDTKIVTPLKLATFAGTQLTTRVFADAVARAAAVPAFDGQIGVQLDTNALIIATGTVAGTFSPNIVIGGTLNVNGNLTNVGYSLSTSSFATTDLSAFGISIVDATGIFTTTALSFETGTQFQIGGTPAADSVLIGRTLGAADSLPLADFISTENTQTGYTNFTNPVVLRTCDTTTVTLPQLAQIVGTLINDLKAVQLPAT